MVASVNTISEMPGTHRLAGNWNMPADTGAGSQIRARVREGLGEKKMLKIASEAGISMKTKETVTVCPSKKRTFKSIERQLSDISYNAESF